MLLVEASGGGARGVGVANGPRNRSLSRREARGRRDKRAIRRRLGNSLSCDAKLSFSSFSFLYVHFYSFRWKGMVYFGIVKSMKIADDKLKSFN